MRAATGACQWTQGAYGRMPLCVSEINEFRRLISGVYCVVSRGIPAHNEGILGGSRKFTDSITI